MANYWLELFSGRIGKYVFEFLSRYYIWFIPFIIAYGIFMTLSSYNLKRMEKRVNYQIVRQAKYHLAKNPKANFLNLVDNIVINWEEIVNIYSFFPYISSEYDFWVTRVTPEKTRSVIMGDTNRLRLVLERHKITFESKDEQIRKNLYADYRSRFYK